MLLPPLTTLGIIDENPMICQGFSVVMHNVSDTFITTFMANNSEEMQQQSLSNPLFPSIMIVSIGESLIDALNSVNWLHQYHADIRVAAYSDNYPEGSKHLLAKAGCIGFLFKNDNKEILLNAIIDILENGSINNKQSNIIQELRNTFIDEKPIGSYYKLLQLVCTDKSYKQIGAELFKSTRTIEEKVSHLCMVQQVNNRLGLMCKAFKKKVGLTIPNLNH